MADDIVGGCRNQAATTTKLLVPQPARRVPVRAPLRWASGGRRSLFPPGLKVTRRVYAAYGGVYVAVAILWLWWIDGIRPSAWDLAGAAVTLLGMAIIAFQPR